MQGVNVVRIFILLLLIVHVGVLALDHCEKRAAFGSRKYILEAGRAHDLGSLHNDMIR